MDEEEKKRLMNEMKRIFQDGYNDLIKEIERLKMELSPSAKVQNKQFDLTRGDVGIVFRALHKYMEMLEHFFEGVKPESPAYMDLDSEIEHTKEVIGIVEEVLYGQASLIFKKS